jgi:hypothetical protein
MTLDGAELDGLGEAFHEDAARRRDDPLGRHVVDGLALEG